MPSKVAQTTYESGPQDKVASSDKSLIASNKANNLLPVNSDESLSLGTLSKLVSKGKGGGILGNLNSGLEAFASVASGTTAGNLTSRLQTVVDSGALNPAEMQKRLKTIGTNLDKVGGDILAQTLKNTGWIDDATVKNLFGNGLEASIKNAKNVASGFRMMVDDVETMVKDIDFGSVTGISNLITAVTGQSDLLKVLGIDDTLASLKLINDISNAWGIPKLADKLFNTLDKDEDKKTYILDLLPSAISSAHLENINLCINQIGAKFIMAQYPQAIYTILGNYRMPAEKIVPTKEDSVALINTLKRLDPNWDKYNRSGQLIFDLGKFSAATETAIAALLLDSELSIPATYASKNNVVEQTWLEVTKTYYPYF